MTNKALALNPFKKGKKTEVEGVRKVDVEFSGLEEVLDKYKLLDKCIGNTSLDSIMNAKKDIKMIEKNIPILNPNKIDIFLQYVIKSKTYLGDEQDDIAELTGFYFSKLIQKSFDNGYNNFVLHVGDMPISCLGFGLKGKNDNRLRLKIEGDIEMCLGAESEKCDFIVNGYGAGCIGNESVDCTYVINGDVDDSIGRDSENCKYFFHGECGTELGNKSKNNIFYVKGPLNWSESCMAEDCIYQTDEKKTYVSLLKCVGQGNKVQLVDKDMKVIREKKIEWY